MLIDEVDPFDARKRFHMSGRSSDEELCRRAFELSGTGVDYSDLSVPEMAAANTWAAALGSLLPTSSWSDDEDEGVLRGTARQAAAAVGEGHEDATIARLAQRLYPAGNERPWPALLAAVGFRVLSNVLIATTATEAVRPPRDRYRELADRTPGTRQLDDDGPESF